ncbi:MAG: SsrA-binding protein SmpB [Anaerolineales bacterium]|nr:SsrA-binding protein SmpB [Anaerolineales bacterium]
MNNNSVKNVATNKKARFEYFLEDSYEAGLVLQGSEIKSIRSGQVSLRESYVKIDGEEAWLIDAHIAPYHEANRFNHDPKRPRKLLLHKKEIFRLFDKIRQRGYAVIPTRMYLKHGKAKVEIALGRGKKEHDKRQTIAKKDAEREIRRAIRRKE